uniref:Uncharacterized protein n=1 Tax=Alexandrium catenella TaxID=2925 RepID=A0A7S1LHQ3_ALECA|mmetsp:Transcript_113882/g.302650  ORF Transcript_113882/g.302650 Transcript_113882/m.302650 type:complete len:158 (+) Transcript_113882:49-522(+)
MAHLAAQAMVHLLRLPSDDPKLVQLAAAAVLMVEQESSAGTYWSSAEMSAKIEGILRMQEKSLSLPDAAPGASSAQHLELLEAAALLAAFEQMRQAVRQNRPLPQGNELLLGAASSLFQRDFVCAREVEAAIASELLGGGRAEGHLSFVGSALPCAA